MSRPALDKHITIANFLDYYWLKKELVTFCREVGIPSGGGKIEVANRIAHFLKTGEVPAKPRRSKAQKRSKFDWHTEKLTTDTIITNSYKNSQNVRSFFASKIGTQFKFNIQFMRWMKENHGKTLGDAVVKWHEIANLKKDPNYKPEIAPQFEYNTYMRDYLASNPTHSSKDAMRCWKVKRGQPGHNKYESGDLLFLENT